MNNDQPFRHRRNQRFFTNLNKLYGQKKIRTYTSLIFSLITTSFFLLFAIKPTIITIAGLIKKIEDQKQVSQTLQQKINDLDSAKKQYLSTQNDLYLINQALPEENQISLLVKQIEALIRRSNVNIDSVQFGKTVFQEKQNEEKSENPIPITINLTISGNYLNLKSFLHSLDTLRRIINTDGFQFNKEKEEKDKLVLSIKSKTFFLNSPGKVSYNYE